MIRSVTLTNFKAHADTTVPLGKLTLLVGDNASGKTSVLEALWLLSELRWVPNAVFSGDWSLVDLYRRNAPNALRLRCTITSGLVTGVRAERSNDPQWQVVVQGSDRDRTYYFPGAQPPVSAPPNANVPLATGLGTAALYSLRAKEIAAVAPSVPSGTAISADGANTASVLSNLKLGADEIFERIERDLRALVPAVRRVRLRTQHLSPSDLQSPLGHKLYFDFAGGEGIPAHGASQGTLLVLSLLTILHSQPRPNLILLDDFDHALHPRAQLELVRLIKNLLALPELAEVQIVATTHSPYTLDEVEPGDVHAFALREDGTVASKRLSEHPQAKTMQGALSTGQLWSLDAERTWVLEK